MKIHGHLIFDWDGTLLDSASLVLAADNAIASKFKWASVTLEYLQANLVREWRDYYDALRALQGSPPLSDAETELVAAAWEAEHEALMVNAALLPRVEAALDYAAKLGFSLSVCSMQRDERLQRYVDQFGLRRRFVLISGLSQRDTGRMKKAAHLKAHIESLRSLAVDRTAPITMIGDTEDDATAAHHAGVNAMLVSTGEYSEARLRRTGVPVTADLHAAIAVIAANSA